MAKIQDLAQYLSNKHKISRKEAERFLTAVVDVLNDALHYEKQAKVKGLGTFKVIDVKDRESVNVNTGERIVIEGRPKITFTPDSVMKELVNKPFAQFDTVVLNDGVTFEDMPDEVAAEEEETIDQLAAEVAPVEEVPETVEPEPQPEIEQLMEDAPVEEQPEEEVEEELPVEEEIPSAVEQPEPENRVEELPVEEKIPVIVEEVAPVVVDQPQTAEVEEPVKEPVEIEEPKLEEPAPKVAAVMEKEPQQEPEEETDSKPAETDDVEEPKSSKSWIWWLFGMIIFGGLMYFTGYQVGSKSGEKPVAESEKPFVTDTVEKVDSAKLKAEIAAKEAEKARAESIAVVQAAKEAEAAKKAAYDAEVAKQQAEEASANDPKALNNARNIVRTGAYNIVGTQQSVVVRKGQTLGTVSKAYLGPGMEVYVMVHNGVTEAKEGSTLKIPKLEVKKKR